MSLEMCEFGKLHPKRTNMYPKKGETFQKERLPTSNHYFLGDMLVFR